jgi:hypothetical protein
MMRSRALGNDGADRGLLFRLRGKDGDCESDHAGTRQVHQKSSLYSVCSDPDHVRMIGIANIRPLRS